ncbi:MAG: porin [Nevskia sp.]|nr:porin [Nevskia sp.]
MNSLASKPAALSLLAAALLSAGAAAAADPVHTDAATAQKLEQQIEQMAQQLEAMKAELQQLKAQNEALAAQQRQQAAQVQQQAVQAQQQAAQVEQAVAQVQAQPQRGGISPDLSLWGYGEIYYTHPVHVPALTQADLARAVFGIGYRFDDRTVFNSEFEVEHAVSSASDKGEFEVEQFYVDHQLASWAAVRGGLFLMPFGLLNEHHEPTSYFGVQRNFVETLVIPSTWREGGFAFHGDTEAGIGWDFGLTTGVNLANWDPNPENPLYRTALDLENSGAAPLQATHQELSLANAQHLSQYVSLSYKGIPGLLAGAAVFTGNAATPTSPPHLPDQRVTLWEAHARWTPGAADLSAVYARGGITNSAAYNLANAGGSNPMPSKFWGYYLQGAYTVWRHHGYRLAPFVRWERYDMGAGYAGIAPGFGPVPMGLAADGQPWPQPHDRVWTYGTNFYLNPHVVVKADYQSFQTNSDFTRFDFGLGLNF